MPGCVEAPRLPEEPGYRAAIRTSRSREAHRRRQPVPPPCRVRRSPACPPPLPPSTLFSQRTAPENNAARFREPGRKLLMFSHVMIGTNDLDKAKSFYDALLGTLDVRPAKVDGHRIFYFTKTGTFSVS